MGCIEEFTNGQKITEHHGTSQKKNLEDQKG